MKKFLLKSIVLTIIILAFGAMGYSMIFKQFYLSILPVVVLFFFIVTNLVHAYLLNIAGKSSSGFSSKYMAASFLKMFLYLAVAIVYLIYNREEARIFIANFLLLYIIFTGFEVYEFLKVVRPSHK